MPRSAVAVYARPRLCLEPRVPGDRQLLGVHQRRIVLFAAHTERLLDLEQPYARGQLGNEVLGLIEQRVAGRLIDATFRLDDQLVEAEIAEPRVVGPRGRRE